MQKGRFITLEGPDGSGKTTNVNVLRDALIARGYTNVVLSREPGGTDLGERIRDILLHTDMAAMTELLLFAAARAEHVEAKIKPALEAGAIVISDRFSDSSFAFQGYARDRIKEVLELEKIVLVGFEPDYTLFFNVTLPECERRMKIRGGENRLDAETLDFKRKVYEGYLRRLETHRHRMCEIDAMPIPSEVSANVIRWVDTVFVPNNPL